MEGGHVDLVDVGALFAVDLYIHEQIVHDRCSVGVFEALMGHHMAPVTGCVADGEENGPVGALRLGERRRAPWPPGDGVVLVLEQIGADLGGETVWH